MPSTNCRPSTLCPVGRTPTVRTRTAVKRVVTAAMRVTYARTAAMRALLARTARGSAVLALLLVALASCAGQGTAAHTVAPAPLPHGFVARSTSGRLLPPMEYAPEELAKREMLLAEARAKLDASPKDADLLVWYGRRLGYLGRFRESIEVFTQGAELHPADPRFLRHRGHRWISLHDFARARADLERSAELAASRPDEVEPAGLPNARGVELDTLKQSIYYHLGLADYLAGDFEAAHSAWRECVKYSNNPDALCAVSHWLYCVLRELGRAADAKAVLQPIRADFDIVENEAYHALLLAYRGERDADALLAEVRAKGTKSNDFATVGYGLGHLWHVDGEHEKALALLTEVAAVPNWPAFGCISADVELSRHRRP